MQALITTEAQGRARGAFRETTDQPAPALAPAGVIRNPRSHRNGAPGAAPPPGVLSAEPRSREELLEALHAFAARGVGRLVIDGGDGTVREVLSGLSEAFAGRPPQVAVLPTGKTNALALDLGARPGWGLAAALAASRTAERTPVEVSRAGADAPVQRGFVFGAGAFVDAVALAHRVHRARVFDSLAVGAALGGVGMRTLLGGGPWRTGVPMRLQHGDEAAREGRRFLLLVSTLERLPLKLRPYGAPRPGMKVLEVAAPPRRVAAALPLLLAGGDRPWLAGAGYRRGDLDRLHVTLHTPYVLDGELYEGGELRLARGAPITFVVP